MSVVNDIRQREQLRVVLVAARNPLNIGAAARAMSNFGFSRLRVVKPYELAFREAKSAVGAAEVLAHAEEFPTIAEAVADCALVVGTTGARNRTADQPLLRLEPGARRIRRHLAQAPVALLFGSEKIGLTNEVLSYCDWLLRVPTREAHASMNLGQAVAVCLYELIRDARVPLAKSQAQPAPAGGLERITTLLMDALHGSGYVKPRTAAATEEKVRRLVRRLHLTSGDAELMLGMLRQVLWGLRRETKR